MTDRWKDSYERNKASGWFKVFLGLGFIILAVPMILFGICQATYNGIRYMTPHNRRVRKINRLHSKREKIEVKEELKILKGDNNE